MFQNSRNIKNVPKLDNQYGSLIHFLDKIYQALNKPESERTLGIFIDLTKAVDTCDIDILLKKLDHYGFRGISNQLV